jgi:hypothetical protein
MNNIISMEKYLIEQNSKEFAKILSFITFVNLMTEQGYSRKETLDLWRASQKRGK